MTKDSTHKSKLERKGIPETNTEGRERKVYRMSKPLKPLNDDPEFHHLLQHQGVYVDPYVWEFGREEKNMLGKEKLKISTTRKKGWDESKPWKNWETYEEAGTTTATDAEIYNSCMSSSEDWHIRNLWLTQSISGRMYKKISNKRYNLRSANCQHAADDVAYHITEGKSTLEPAPSRRVSEILSKKVREDGLPKTALKLVRTTKHFSNHQSRAVPMPGRKKEKLVYDNEDEHSDHEDTNSTVDYEKMLSTLGTLALDTALFGVLR